MKEAQIDPGIIWNIIIFALIGVILGTSYLMYAEYAGARDSCVEKGGEFKFNFPNEYFCNDKPFLKYIDGGWDWEREVNYSAIDFSKLKFS